MQSTDAEALMEGGHKALESIQGAVPGDKITQTALCFPVGVLSRGRSETSDGLIEDFAGQDLGRDIGGGLGDAVDGLGDIAGAASMVASAVQEEHQEIILALGQKALYVLNQPVPDAIHRWRGLKVVEEVPLEGLEAHLNHEVVNLAITLISSATGKTYRFQSKLLRSGAKELVEAINK